MSEIKELLPRIAKRIAEEHSEFRVRVRALAFDKDGYVRFSRYPEKEGREMNRDGDWMGYENGVWPAHPVITRDANMQPYQELGKRSTNINEEEDEELFDELNLMIDMSKL